MVSVNSTVFNQILNTRARLIEIERKIREQEEILERVAELEDLMEQTQRGRRGA